MSLTETIDAAADAYWRARLAGLADRAGFPPDLPATSADAAGPAAKTALAVPAPLADRLRRLSRDDHAALHVAVTAGVVALLGRYTGAEQVAVGVPSYDCPTNPLLVLGTAPGGTFRELLGRLRDEVRLAASHQDYPLLRLAAEHDRPGWVDVAVQLAGQDPALAELPLPVLITIEPAPMLLTIRYDAGRFTAGGAARIGRHLVRLLDLATAEPDLPLAEHDLRTAEDDRVTAASNATAAAFDERATLHALFERQAAATPHAPAVLAPDGAVLANGVVTYAELDARANRLARTLRGHGARSDEPVAVLAERSVELLVAILAVLKAGAAYLPIDPGYPRARVEHLLADSTTRLAVAQSRFAGLVAGVPGVHVIDLDDERSYDAGAGPLTPAGAAGDLAYVIYTSGSTGQPKGVMVEHRSVVNRLTWMQRAYPIGTGDVVLQKTSISFDVSVWELFWWAITGATVALLEPGAEKDPGRIVAAIERHRVTTAHFVPSMLGLFLAHVDRFAGAERLRGLRRVFTSGEALGPHHVTSFAKLVPGASLVNLYGPTEATVDVSHQPCTGPAELAAPAEPAGQATVPIGRPIDNTRLYVLDQAGRPLPVGMPGELCIAGVGLARGYRHRDDLTAERFGPGGHVGETRIYRTGDRARWLPDGSLDFLGRLDEQVKIRGFRIEPAEIEQRLLAHPAVAEAAVVAHDDGWQSVLRAYIVGAVVAAGAVSGEAELKEHVRVALPEYMVPSRIEWLAALPLTPNGKLDRAALAGQRRRATATGRGAPAEHVEPRDERERALARIWREVLGVPRVGVHDNFFALGGNSIHFVSVLAAARTAGLDFTFQQLFRHQTIATLAAAIDGERAQIHNGPAGETPFALLAPADRAKVPDGVADAYPLSMLQAGLIFQTEVTGGLGQYHDVLGYLVRAPFDADAFEGAVRVVVRRHPILRTSYRLTGFDEFVQLVHDDVAPPISVVDLRGRTRAEQDRYNDDWVAAEKARPFAWERGALVSLHVQVLADDLFRYTVSQHNSALDGWSISLLHSQLFAAYTSLRAGRPVETGPVDHHLRNFVELERAALAEPRSREFWLDVLRDTAPTKLPRRPGASDTSDFRVVLHDVALPAGITERVLALAASLSVPMKDVLLAAHVKVLSEFSTVAGRRTVLTGYEHSGRPELPGAESALGLFLNTVPLRVDVGEGSWADLVREVYRAELDLLPHRRYPMAQMKHDAGARATLFETTFNYTHFYLLKRLHELPEFALLDLRVDSETEFVFRTEFSTHFLDDQLRLCLHYHSHLFDPAQIERIGGYFVRVLELMTGEPHARHAARPLLAEADRALLAAGWSTEPVAYGNLAPAPVPDTAGREALERVAAVWARVLDVEAHELDGDSDFFALGGNSLSALRVVLELDGMVTLTDLNRHPRLGDVAGLLERRGRPGPALLHLLSSSAAGARCALVCVPYPCGHPINFGPLANELEELTTDLVVYGVELPGHDPNHPGEFVPVADAARLIAAELATTVDLPVMLWGHCGGAAVTVELARQLEAAGQDLRHAFIGSKLLPTVADMRESIAMIEGWTDEQIIRFMVDETGYTDLDGLDPEHSAFMAAVFRHDVLGGFGYFIDATLHPGPRLTTPVTFVIAADDPGLAQHRDEYTRWELLAAQVRPHVLATGGHYFVRANPAGTAELVERTWVQVS